MSISVGTCRPRGMSSLFASGGRSSLHSIRGASGDCWAGQGEAQGSDGHPAAIEVAAACRSRAAPTSCGFKLLLTLMLLTESLLRPFGTNTARCCCRCCWWCRSSRISAGGGQPKLNGNSWPADGTAESRDEEDEAIDEAPERPSGRLRQKAFIGSTTTPR